MDLEYLNYSNIYDIYFQQATDRTSVVAMDDDETVQRIGTQEYEVINETMQSGFSDPQ